MLVLGGLDTNTNKPNTVIRVNFNTSDGKPSVRVSNSMPYGLTLHGSAVVPTVNSTGDAQIWTFGGSNANGTRQSIMLFVNFNRTLDAASFECK